MLTEQRQKIDELDQKIVALLEERMNVVSEVARVKADNNLPVLDSQREALLLSKISGYVKDPAYTASIVKLYEDMMAISRAYQETQIN